MTVRNPRVNVVFEKSLYDIIKEISEREKVSMSTVVREFTKEALEIKEDLALFRFAEEREKTLNKSELLSHDKVWG